MDNTLRLLPNHSTPALSSMPALDQQGEYALADVLYLNAIAILEKSLGPDNPYLAISLRGRADALQAQVIRVLPSGRLCAHARGLRSSLRTTPFLNTPACGG